MDPPKDATLISLPGVAALARKLGSPPRGRHSWTGTAGGSWDAARSATRTKGSATFMRTSWVWGEYIRGRPRRQGLKATDAKLAGPGCTAVACESRLLSFIASTGKLVWDAWLPQYE